MNAVNKSGTDLIRHKAEELLKKRTRLTDAFYTEADPLKLIHELEVYQIELELLNEELLHAWNEAEVASERKYTELYDHAPSGFFTLSLQGEITELNLSGAKMLGKARSTLVHSNFGFFTTLDTRRIFNDFIQLIFETTAKQSCEVELNTDENGPVCVYLEGIISGTGKECLVSVVDITLRKLAEAELLKAKEKAEESDRLKTAFLANISHEIRTPLNSILGFAELLKGTDLNEDSKTRYVNIIEKSGGRLLNIINNILTISKLESGQMEISISETNMNEQIETVYSLYKPIADQKQIRLSYRTTLPEKKAMVNTDMGKLLAVLTNLVKNALKYTEKGSIEIGYQPKGKYLEFYVRDTGPGIPVDRYDAIFDRFVQSDIANKGAKQGAGLGLSIAKAYVEMLGGTIWLKSEPGKGSVFFFTLPYKS